MREAALPIVLTEGEFKTLALWRAANHGTPSCPRFLPVAVSGVYNWRGTIGKTVGPDGSRLDVKGAIADLDWLVWAGRRAEQGASHSPAWSERSNSSAILRAFRTSSVWVWTTMPSAAGMPQAGDSVRRPSICTAQTKQEEAGSIPSRGTWWGCGPFAACH